MISIHALRRTRLAFLLLGVGGVALSGAQVALFGSEGEGLQPWGWLALAVLVVAWVDLYRSGRARWWRDVGVGVSLHVFGIALLFPTMGLVLYLFAILLHVLYGTRRDAGRAVTVVT